MEKVINAVLEDKLPSSLLGVERTLPRYVLIQVCLSPRMTGPQTEKDN